MDKSSDPETDCLKQQTINAGVSPVRQKEKNNPRLNFDIKKKTQKMNTSLTWWVNFCRSIRYNQQHSVQNTCLFGIKSSGLLGWYDALRNILLAYIRTLGTYKRLINVAILHMVDHVTQTMTTVLSISDSHFQQNNVTFTFPRICSLPFQSYCRYFFVTSKLSKPYNSKIVQFLV